MDQVLSALQQWRLCVRAQNEGHLDHGKFSIEDWHGELLYGEPAGETAI